MFLGILLLAVLSLIPKTAVVARSLWPTLLTEIVILATGTVPMLVGGPVLIVFLVALSARVFYEVSIVGLLRCGRAVESPGFKSKAAAGSVLVGAGVVGAGCWLGFPAAFYSCAGLAVPMAITIAFGSRTDVSPVNVIAESLIFPGLFLVLFAAAAGEPALRGALLLAFLLVETYDSYALLGGKLAGKRKAFPKLSPNKTVEGLAFGALALAATATVGGYLLVGADPLAMLGLAALIALFSVAGDLAASRLKRLAGVKDYPAVMPRQGGVFDIADAWIMTGPTVVAAVYWLSIA
nr:phosphatidate cytidylyltransferase [Hongsoonwoonella zoysiae]